MGMMYPEKIRLLSWVLFHSQTALVHRYFGAALDGSTAALTHRTAQKGLGQRSQVDFSDTEGWRSTKQRRRHSYPASNTVNFGQGHILDSDGKLPLMGLLGGAMFSYV